MMYKTFIAAQFRRPSGSFGLLSAFVMRSGNKGKYERLVKELELQPSDNILEIGYGPGIGIDMVAEACPLCTIHGIDFSELMYNRARKYNSKHLAQHNVLLQHGDFLAMPLSSTTYDKVYCLNVVHFWKELQEPFQKVLSLLKPAGTFHLYMPHRDALQIAPASIVKLYTVEQVVEALPFVGFANVVYFSENGYYIKAKKQLPKV